MQSRLDLLCGFHQGLELGKLDVADGVGL